MTDRSSDKYIDRERVSDSYKKKQREKAKEKNH